jgi:ssDNA-binding Zn-finger/Zn-ribbon topoisomerase 1
VGREVGDVMDAEPNPTCPACGHLLSMRKGPAGHFIGCDGYPRCRFSCDLQKTKRAGAAVSWGLYLRSIVKTQPSTRQRQLFSDSGDYYASDEAEAFYDAFMYDVGDR